MDYESDHPVTNTEYKDYPIINIINTEYKEHNTTDILWRVP